MKCIGRFFWVLAAAVLALASPVSGREYPGCVHLGQESQDGRSACPMTRTPGNLAGTFGS